MAFALRSLSPAEQKYSAGEREALGCAWACVWFHIMMQTKTPGPHSPADYGKMGTQLTVPLLVV